jgi:hypothetical protein
MTSPVPRRRPHWALAALQPRAGDERRDDLARRSAISAHAAAVRRARTALADCPLAPARRLAWRRIFGLAPAISLPDRAAGDLADAATRLDHDARRRRARRGLD